MRLHFLVAAASTVCIYPLTAQTSKILDLHTGHSRSSFYVVLAARGGSATGHAFVVWGVEDARRHRTTVRALGLYPDSGQTNCIAVARTVPGGVLDELKTHSLQGITQELIVRVDKSGTANSR